MYEQLSRQRLDEVNMISVFVRVSWQQVSLIYTSTLTYATDDYGKDGALEVV